MVADSLFDRLRKVQQRFRAAQDGNIAVLFALALLPITGAVGAAVDFSHASSVKLAMQAAVDSTALMLSKEAATLTSSDMTKKATNYFKATFNRPEVKNIAVKLAYSAASKTLTVTSSGKVKADFMGILGFKQLNVAASSTVSWGGKKVEIALVLDNTGSMATSGKMDALLKATDQFLTTMQKAAAEPGDVRIAIVPFDFQVNIGKAYNTKPWIDWSLLAKNGGGDRDDDDDIRDDDNNDKAAIAAWSGCVIDRTQPHDVLDTAPTNDPNTWYPAVNCKLAEIQPLTSDFTLLKSMAAKMKTAGKTNLTIGLVWGWHVLTKSEPMVEATLPSKNINKYLIFMTDGLNTQNRWSANAKDIDARTRLVCANIKAAQITVFTIRMLEGNAALLRDCASGPTNYFDVTQASQLTAVFSKIAEELSKLRISK